MDQHDSLKDKELKDCLNPPTGNAPPAGQGRPHNRLRGPRVGLEVVQPHSVRPDELQLHALRHLEPVVPESLDVVPDVSFGEARPDGRQELAERSEWQQLWELREGATCQQATGFPWRRGAREPPRRTWPSLQEHGVNSSYCAAILRRKTQVLRSSFMQKTLSFKLALETEFCLVCLRKRLEPTSKTGGHAVMEAHENGLPKWTSNLRPIS